MPHFSTRWQRATGTSGTILAVGEALRAQDSKQKSQGAQPLGAEVVLSRLARFNERVAETDQSERRDAQSLCLQLSSKLDCDREIAAAESKSELFEEVFGCELALGPTEY